MTSEPTPPDDGIEAETAWILQRCLDRLAAGDPRAKEDLFQVVDAQVRKRAHQMLRSFRIVRQSYDTGDVAQEASLRLIRSLEAIQPEDPRRFLGLVGLHIRRTLIDLYRHCRGPQSYETNRATNAYRRADGELGYRAEEVAAAGADPDQAVFERLHEAAATLEPADQEIFHMRWFLGMTHEQIANVVGCSEKTIKRSWNSIKDLLRERAGVEGP